MDCAIQSLSLFFSIHIFYQNSTRRKGKQETVSITYSKFLMNQTKRHYINNFN